MAGPRFLGITNITNPYDTAQRAVQDAGAIYMQFNEDARRAEEAARVRDEANRARQERETLATYAPKIGENFFGIDADTQNLIRQNEAEVLRQNDEALARKDPTAVSREELEKSFLTTRSQLADRNTVLNSVINDLVAQGVSLENAETRAKQISSQYGSVGDLAAAEQARVEALNKAEADRLQNVLSLYKTDSSNRRTLVSEFTDNSSSSRRTSTPKVTGKSYAPGQPISPKDVVEAIDGVAQLTGNTGFAGIGRGDADKAVQSALSAYTATNEAIAESNEAIRQAAIENGRDASREQYEPLLKWDDVLGRVTETLQLDQFNARGTYNTVGTARAGITEPLRRRNQIEQIRGGGSATTSSTTRSGIPFDAAARILAGSPDLVAAALRQPAVARSLSDINKERVASVYAQYQRSAPVERTSSAAAPTATAERPVSQAPAQRPTTTQRQVPPPPQAGQGTPNPNRRGLGTPPPISNQEIRLPISTRPLGPSIPAPTTSGGQQTVTPLARPNLNGLTPTIAGVVQAASTELADLYAQRDTLPENRREALQQRINETEAGLREVGVYDRVKAVVDRNIPVLVADRKEVQAAQERLKTFRELQAQANDRPFIATNRNLVQFETDRALAQAKLARMVKQNPELLEQARRQDEARKEDSRKMYTSRPGVF